MPLWLKIFLINFLSLALFIVDRAAKLIFSGSGGEYFVFGDWFKLKFAANPGLAFGLGRGFGDWHFIFLFLYFLIFLFLAYFLTRDYRQKKFVSVFALTFVIFGAVSNLWDRICFGHVIDYFDLRYFTVFNLADAMIVAGAAMIILARLKTETKLN